MNRNYSLKENANRMDKGFLYETYLRSYRENAKDYDSITRKKMVDALIKKYTPEYILSICTCTELKYLEKLLNGNEQTRTEIKKNKSQYEFEIENLEFKRLVISCYIWEEFVEPIKQALQMVDWDMKEQEESKVAYLLGYLKSTVIADMYYMEALATMICDHNEKEAIKLLGDNSLFDYYAEFTNDYKNEKGTKVPVFIYSEYYDEIEDITLVRGQYDMQTPEFLSDESYRSIFYYGYDKTNEIVNEFFNRFKDSPAYFNYKNELLFLARFDVQSDYEDVLKLKPSSSKDWKKVQRLMPSAVLRGMSLEAYEKAVTKREEVQKLKKLNVSQRNAHISEKDSKAFCKYYFSLLEFVNKKYQISPNLDIYRDDDLDFEEVVKVSNVFFEHKDEALDAYLKLNPLKLTKRGLRIVNGFRQGVKGTMTLYRYEEKYSVFMDDEHIYMVKGLFDNIDQMIPADRLPVVVDVTLFPFADSVISDGLIGELPIQLGPNQMERLEKEYQENPKIYSFEVKRFD